MKILLSLTSSRNVKGGVEVFSDHLKKAFPDLKMINYDSTGMADRNTLPLFRQPIYAKRLCSWFTENIDKYNPDMVFTSGMDGWNIHERNVGCPVVNIQHGTFAAFAKAALRRTSPNYWRIRCIYSHYEKLASRNATKTVSNSHFTRENVLKHYGVDSTVIHNAIDTNTIKPVKNARQKLGLPANKKIAIFVGRPDHTKGFDIVEGIASKFKETLFLCVLPFPRKTNQKNMRIFSNIPHKDLAKFYSAADVCINPSRFDGFGYVPLEALACNTPVIGSMTGIFMDSEIAGFTPVRDNIEEYCSVFPEIKSKVNPRGEIKKNFSLERFRKSYNNLIKNL